MGYSGFSPRFLLDVTRINFLGIGHTVNFQGRISNLEQRGLINYTIPRFLSNDRRTATFSTLYDQKRDVLTFSSKREEGSMQVSQKLTLDLGARWEYWPADTPQFPAGFSNYNPTNNTLVLAGYLLPWAVLAYYLMKSREVAA